MDRRILASLIVMALILAITNSYDSLPYLSFDNASVFILILFCMIVYVMYSLWF